MRRALIALFVVALVAPITIAAQSVCADGTTSHASGRGACSHHGGVARRESPAPAQRAQSGDITLPEKSASRASSYGEAAQSSRAAEAAAAKVWVNTKSGVYHCRGTRWYGATKSGEYMSESAARASGNRPAYGRSCS